MADAVDVAGIVAWMNGFQRRVHLEVTYLTDLDSAIGDGDHGVNMDRGMAAVVAALGPAVANGSVLTVGAALHMVGMTLVSTVGGAAGPLYGTMFLRMADGLAETVQLDTDGLTDAFARGLEGLRARGRALAGDKTMIDALTPAVDAMRTAATEGATLAPALAAAAQAAEAGRDATAPMLARKGRASYLGERTIGHIDPGSGSMAFLVAAAREAFGA
ncbi:MAG: dihydroxyacetone kinase subunit L [Bifidobacteriaceae bacterium]|jgi:dihydroxyacetone kinase-like protein|nr:dihydroxyacetone kinase subunit L [Bifidobacteriaceae bacterium]